MKEMQGEVGRLVMEAASRILDRQAGSDQDLAMYDQFIKKAGDPHDDSSC